MENAEKKLTDKQQKYYDERVAYYGTLRADGRKIAIPYGLIHKWAIEMSDADIDAWFADPNDN